MIEGAGATLAKWMVEIVNEEWQTAHCKGPFEYTEAETAGDHHSSFCHLQGETIWRGYENFVPALMLADRFRICG